MVKKLQDVCPDFFNLTAGITIFPASNGGGEGLAKWANVPFLGRIPIFTSLEQAGESGQAVIDQGGQVAVTISRIVNSELFGIGMICRYFVSCESLVILYCLLNIIAIFGFHFSFPFL